MSPKQHFTVLFSISFGGCALAADDAGVTTTGGFFGFDSLVETAQSGYQSLDWDYYLALTNCVTQLEDELAR